jgi:toxin ParE1/3/4
MKHLVYLPAALADLKAITLFIADDNPDRAISFVDELRSIAAEAAQRPASFPARDDLAPGLRAARYGRYLIFFQEIAGDFQIVRVLHGARDLQRVFNG